MRTTRDDDDIARDGEVLRVPMYLADSGGHELHDGAGNEAGHKRGYAFARPGSANAARHDAYTSYESRLRDAWRCDRNDETDDGCDPRAAYIRRLGEAWRGAR